MNRMSLWLGLAGFAMVALLQSAFIVSQTQQALITRFGDIQRVVKDPGLDFKVPFIDSVEYFDNRLLEFNAQPQEFITRDLVSDVQERVVIDAFVRYRIIDPVRFYQAVRSESNLESRLGSVVIANMRKIIAQNSLSDLLSAKRVEIMHEIKKAVNFQAQSETVEEFAAETPEGQAKRTRRQGFGIQVVDVRILRADLPEDISQSTFERMRKNFTKEAQRFRAEGEEKALQIRSNADRERTEILAQAQKESETIRGEGDGAAAKIYSEAFNKDPGFYGFYRSMQAYRKALKQDDTTLILSPKGEFLDEMN